MRLRLWPRSLAGRTASVLLIGLLLIWWFLLVNPLLAFLRGSLAVTSSLYYGAAARELVSETPTGDWSFHVPMEIVLPPSAEHPGGAQVHSIDFDMQRAPKGDSDRGMLRSDGEDFAHIRPVSEGSVFSSFASRRAPHSVRRRRGQASLKLFHLAYRLREWRQRVGRCPQDLN